MINDREWHGDVDLIRYGLADGTYVEQRISAGAHLVPRARFDEEDKLVSREMVLSIYPTSETRKGARGAFVAWLRAMADALESMA